MHKPRYILSMKCSQGAESVTESKGGSALTIHWPTVYRITLKKPRLPSKPVNDPTAQTWGMNSAVSEWKKKGKMLRNCILLITLIRSCNIYMKVFLGDCTTLPTLSWLYWQQVRTKHVKAGWYFPCGIRTKNLIQEIYHLAPIKI